MRSSTWPLLLTLLGGCDYPGCCTRGSGNGAATSGKTEAPAQIPSLVSVHLAGHVSARSAPAGELLVAVGDGPCFVQGTHYYAVQRIPSDGKFDARMFPPLGTSLEVCAALVDKSSATTRFWARAAEGPWRADSRTGTERAGIELVLGASEEVTIPPGLRAAR